MPSVKLSPLFNDAQLDNNGLPLSGGQVYWYVAGTSTPVTVYTESSGSTVNTNPVVLNTRGEPVQPIWLPTGQAYKAVLTDAAGGLIRTVNNIYGVNDTSAPVISEWVSYAGTATYVSTSSFSVAGDQRSTFTNGRRIKATVSGTDVYGTINASPTYALGVTTVLVTLDGGVFDSSLTTVYYGFLDPTHPSFDTTGVNTNTKAGIQAQTWTAFTSGGTSGVYTLTPVPAIFAYAVGQRFNVMFNAVSASTNTININGLGAKSLKMYNSAGTKIDAVFALNQVIDIIYDGTDFVMNLLQGGLVSPSISSPIISGEPTGVGVLTSGTLQTAPFTPYPYTSATFTGIPSWVKRITIMISGLSTASTGVPAIRLGTSVGVENTGYVSCIAHTNATAVSNAVGVASGFEFINTGAASSFLYGTAVLTNINGNSWVFQSNIYQTTTNTDFCNGSKTLAGLLTQIQLTITGGTDVFDAGSINIMYE